MVQAGTIELSAVQPLLFCCFLENIYFFFASEDASKSLGGSRIQRPEFHVLKFLPSFSWLFTDHVLSDKP
jgi:hypothetical protein